MTSVGTESGDETRINITSFKFPLESGSYRFQVVDAGEKMVSYVCSGTNLLRAKSTAITASASCPTSNTDTATVSIMASRVTCNFDYNNSVDLQRNALVSMVLTIQDSSSTETVSLQHEVHVSNTP